MHVFRTWREHISIKTDVKVINAGIGYTADKLTLSVVPRGSNALFEPRVRRLTIDNKKVKNPFKPDKK